MLKNLTRASKHTNKLLSSLDCRMRHLYTALKIKILTPVNVMTISSSLKEEGTQVELENVSWMGKKFEYAPRIPKIDEYHSENLNNEKFNPLHDGVSFETAVGDVWMEFHKK